MKSFKYLLLVIPVLCLFAVSTMQAQAPVIDASSATDGDDPIIEVLDSLVMLNNVIRFQNVSNQQLPPPDYNEKEVPFYSDEIYAQRISKLYSPIPLTYNDQVRNYIELYAYKRKKLTGRVLGLSNLYFPLFEEILDQEGLPLEFRYLSVVESALNPVAVSRVGATGLWQFMFNTGKMYNLKINSYYDERRDPEKATRAACQYFKDMYAIYGDWLLVIAAYNCGPGNVNKAIRRAGGSKDFWEISPYLPKETRGYVPAFIAVTYVMNYAGEHNIFPEQAAFNYFDVDTVAIDRKIALSKISQKLDIPLDVLTYLNPIYKRGVIPDSDEPNVLRLPATSIPAYLAAEADLFGPEEPENNLLLASSTTSNEKSVESGKYTLESKRVKKVHVVKSGESLSVISGRLNCRVSDLQKWNRLSGTMIHKGQRLAYYKTIQVKVPVSEPEADEPELAADTNNSNNNSKIDSSQIDDKAASSENTKKTHSRLIYHEVVKGDTLWNIAQRYDGVTVEEIIEINRITNKNSLKPGTKLKVKVNG